MPGPVCVITNAYPDLPGSYHGSFIRRTVEDLAVRGWRSYVLAPRIYRESPPRESFPTHDIRRFPFLSAQKLLIEYERTPYLRVASLVTSGTAASVSEILRHGCGLIHAHWAFPAGLVGLAAARVTGRPLILTVHGSDQRLAAERGGVAAQIFRTVARGAARVQSVSGPITDYLLSIGVPAGRILTRPLGVDESVFNASVQPDKDSADSFGILSTRSLLPLYRVEDLVRAAARLRENIPRLHLVLAGEGPERGSLESLGAELGLGDRLTFTGRLTPPELARQLAACRVYVSTSPADGTSVSLLEALALGCLPVVADIPSNRDWVSLGVNGLLFPPGDIDSLAECILQASRDSALAARARSEGPRLVAARGLWRGQIETLDSLYSELWRG
ncbi:glycosyltransferase [bacterium]|nr:glycosyltransferase [bacterium]